MVFKIVILPNDGIAHEIINQAVIILNAIRTKFGYQFEYEYVIW